MKLGNRNQQKAVLMLPWAVLMVLRCELVRLYIQPNLDSMLAKTNFGLYQHDELILLGTRNGHKKP